MNTTLFHFGPYEVSFLNLIIISIIVIVAILMRRVIHRNLKRYLINANIRVEGRKVTMLRLFSQLVYLVAIYLIILSFKINNPNVTFGEFMNSKIIDANRHRQFMPDGLSYSHLLSVVLIFLFAKAAIHGLRLLIGKRLRTRKDYDAGTEYVYVQIMKYIVYLLAIIISLDVLNVNFQSVLIGSAGLFLGIGLALQDVFKDFFAGIVLLLEGNLKVGDVIEINNPGDNQVIVAKILKITVRTTQIETREGNVLIIPNTKLTQENIENWSHGSDLTRFMITVGVAYGSDTQEVIRLMKQAAMSHPKVKKSQGVNVRLADFGDSALNFELIFWADQSWEINNYKSEIRLEIDRLFREYGITIPFPQRDLHIKTDLTK